MPSKHRFDNFQVSFGTVIPTSDSPQQSAQANDVRINTDATSPISMWKCTAGGTPGTWVALSSGAGTNGTNGTNGINAFTTVTTSFAQPASAATVSVTFGTTAWMAQNQIIYIATGGYYLVSSITNSTVAVIQNLGYAGNAVAATTIVSTSRVSPGGIQGPAGATGTAGAAGADGVGSNNFIDLYFSYGGEGVGNAQNGHLPTYPRTGGASPVFYLRPMTDNRVTLVAEGSPGSVWDYEVGPNISIPVNKVNIDLYVYSCGLTAAGTPSIGIDLMKNGSGTGFGISFDDGAINQRYTTGIGAGAPGFVTGDRVGLKLWTVNVSEGFLVMTVHLRIG